MSSTLLTRTSPTPAPARSAALIGVFTRGHLSQAAVWLGPGFLGGYTTFSTFTYETVRLIEDGAWAYAAWNLVLSGPLSFGGAALGYTLSRWIA